MTRDPDVTLSQNDKKPSARHHRSDVAGAIPCDTVIRPFVGPQADKVAVLCRPQTQLANAARQADAAYRALAMLLAARQSTFADLTTEMLFLRDIRHDLPLVLAARERVLAEFGDNAVAPIPSFVQQAPVAPGVLLELMAWADLPHQRGALAAHDIRAASTCACEGCARSGARLVCLGASGGSTGIRGETTNSTSSSPPAQSPTALYTTNVYGVGEDAYTQTLDMFGAAERLLKQCGMDFHDVIRTWIYLRDIDRDYDALNAARREFFRQRGIKDLPASTAVQGMPFSDLHDLSLCLQAIQASPVLDVTPMATPNLSEAWSYGADFSRGLRVGEAHQVTLHVSGTASLDASGRSVHAGDVEAQIDRMLDNIESLLARQGATFADVISGVTYLKHARDAAVLRERCQHRGYTGFPCAVVEANLCRPELLCEAEAVAILPFEPARA